MARILYSVLFYSLMPLILLRMLWRSRRAPAYRQRWAERFGRAPYLRGQGAIWLHAVSVGETNAAIGTIEHLLQTYPERPLLVTTTTPTGSARLRQLFGDRVLHVYAPYDLPFACQRFLQRVQPSLVLVMETELWPNWMAACRQRQIPVRILNARLSQKSASGYAKLPALVAPMLADIDGIAAQAEADARRFAELGAPAQRVPVMGNVKYDFELQDLWRERAAQLRLAMGERPVWMAASTHPGEEEQILQCHRQLLAQWPDLLLLLVPRHPERFNGVAQLIEAQELTLQRRSVDNEQCDSTSQVKAQVYLADTMGELAMLFGAADLVWMGGSFAEIGGHNFLEPAAWGKPLLSGPHLFNFAEISERLLQAGALRQVADAQQLAQELQSLLQQPQQAAAMGAAARAVLDQNRGAQQRLNEWIDAVVATA